MAAVIMNNDHWMCRAMGDCWCQQMMSLLCETRDPNTLFEFGSPAAGESAPISPEVPQAPVEGRKENQDTITDWANDTFGPSDSNIRIAARANEEMAELLRALSADDDNPKAAEEIADVVIVLYRVASRLGYDLHRMIDRKMEINRGREWKLDNTGHGYHVRDKSATTPATPSAACVGPTGQELRSWWMRLLGNSPEEIASSPPVTDVADELRQLRAAIDLHGGATPSAAVGAGEPGAGDEKEWCDGAKEFCERQVESETVPRAEYDRVVKLNHHLREVAVMAIVERVPSDSKPSNSINPESEDTPPHNPVMGPVVGTATVKHQTSCPAATAPTVPPEVGKRYVCGNGEVTDAMTLDGGPAYPFMARTGHVLRSWRGDGRHDESKISEYDLIAEYHEPEPYPPAESPSITVPLTEREKQVLGELSARQELPEDRVMIQALRLYQASMCSIPDIPKASCDQPAESPDDWVPQDRVPARAGIDERRLVQRDGTALVWVPVGKPGLNGMRHGEVSNGDRLELRCRRKDLPGVPAESHAPQPSCSPVCALCGNLATCFGQYADHDKGFACDSCCGHGNEDGWCMPVVPVKSPAMPSPWRPMTEVPTSEWFWSAWDDGKVILSRDRVHWPCPYAIAWMPIEKPQHPNSAPADSPRMRQVTLREYRLDSGPEWTTYSRSPEPMMTCRTAVVEVPE